MPANARLSLAPALLSMLLTACAPTATSERGATAEAPMPEPSLTVTEHLPSAPKSLRKEIDELVMFAGDPWAGRERKRAIKRLVMIGAPSIPAHLQRMARLDFEAEDSRVDEYNIETEESREAEDARFEMVMLNDSLWKLCGEALSLPRDEWVCRVGFRETESADVEACRSSRERWLALFRGPAGQSLLVRAEADLKQRSH